MTDNGTLRAFLIISRARIQVVSFASATLGVLLGAGTIGDVLSLDVLAFVILFYIIVTFACNINCYYDYGVDRLGKKRLAAAVRYLGHAGLGKLMMTEVAAVLFTSMFLLARGHRVVALLGLLGLYSAWSYSAPPLRMKGRGGAGPVPVTVGIYILPIFAGYLLVKSVITHMFLAFVSGYALMNLGINLVNTCEDFGEDKRMGIRTAAHALGLRRTLDLAFLMCLMGGGLALLSLLGMGYQRFHAVDSITLLALMFFFTAMITVFATSKEILDAGRQRDPERSAKIYAPRMPRWFIMTRYPMWLFALTLLFI